MITWSALTVVHVTGGSLAILSGFVAFFAQKGAWLHRTAGNVFFLSMLVMSSVASYLAVRRMEQLVGILTFYLVATAWASVIRKEGRSARFEIGAMLVAAAVAVGYFTHATAVQAGLKDVYPAEMYFAFGSVAALAALLDVTTIARGGVAGAQRIARHLWRMSVAMFIATGSYFLGQPKFVPAILRETNLNLVPVILVIALFVFWLVRVLFTRWYARGASEPSQGAAHQGA
jgi:hypothetical protein